MTTKNSGGFIRFPHPHRGWGMMPCKMSMENNFKFTKLFQKLFNSFYVYLVLVFIKGCYRNIQFFPWFFPVLLANLSWKGYYFQYLITIILLSPWVRYRIISHKPENNSDNRILHLIFCIWTEYGKMCVSGGKKCSFFGKFGVLCFLQTSILRFGLFRYYRRYMKTYDQYFWKSMWCMKCQI